MKEALKFVKGAVGKGDDATQTHYHIGNNQIKSYNGIITLCSPIPLDIEATPSAAAFSSAIALCEDTTSISVAKNNKLIVKSGPFKASIDCLPGESPYMLPEGVEHPLSGPLLPTLKKLAHIIPKQSPHPWNRGMLLYENFVNVTDNAVLVQQWHPHVFPRRANVPEDAIRALIRIGKEPASIQSSNKSITFHFEDGSWLKTKLLEDMWPKSVDDVLSAKSDQKPIPDVFFDAVEKIRPFTDIDTRAVAISDGFVAAGGTASYEVPGLCATGNYDADKLLLIKDIAETIDFSTYPQPALFYGDQLRGAVIGMKVQ